jgi:hypothetical protein
MSLKSRLARETDWSDLAYLSLSMVYHGKPWYTIELMELSKEVKNKYQKYRMNGEANSKESYTTLLKRYLIEIDLAIKKYNSELIQKAANKSKAAWSIIHKNNNSAASKKDADITLQHEDNDVTSPKEVADLFNCFFF